MEQPQNQKPTDSAKSGSKFVDDLLKNLGQLPDKEKILEVSEAISDNFSEMVKLIVAAEHLRRARYMAMLKAGFTEEQAMRLLCSGQ